MKGCFIGYTTRSYIYNIKLPKICTMFSAKLHFPYFNGYVFLIIRDIVSHSSISIILFTSFNNLFLWFISTFSIGILLNLIFRESILITKSPVKNNVVTFQSCSGNLNRPTFRGDTIGRYVIEKESGRGVTCYQTPHYHSYLNRFEPEHSAFFSKS